VNFIDPAATLAVITVGAGRHDVRPDMLSAHVAWGHMVNGQAAIMLATVLAGIIIAAKNLAAGQLDVGARSMDLILQPDNGGPGQQFTNRPNVSTPVDDHVRLARQEQADRSPRSTNIDRLKIGI
jgi:hypothetical protein